MKRQIGVSSLTLCYPGKNGPRKTLAAARKAGLLLQLVLLAGWTTDGISEIPPAKVVSLEKLHGVGRGFVSQLIFEGDYAAFYRNWNFAMKRFPHAARIGYDVPVESEFIHALAHLGKGTWASMLHLEPQPAGFVVDSCHAMYPAHGHYLAQTPMDFYVGVRTLLGQGKKLIYHWQPSRWPGEGGNPLITHNLAEIVNFVLFKSSSRLGYMLFSIKSAHQVPVIIELDPKLKVLFTTWGFLGLLKMIKSSIEQTLEAPYARLKH